MKLFDSFDGEDFSPHGGLYFKDNEEQRAGRVEFQGGALKLSVEASNISGNGTHSERAEIWEKTELRVPYDQAVWYGFAVKFADPIPQDDHRYLIAQWKREIGKEAQGDFSPFLALRMKNGKIYATVETNYHPPSQAALETDFSPSETRNTPVWLRPETNQMRAIVAADRNWRPDDNKLFRDSTDRITVIDRGNNLPTPDSGWIDFAIMTKPGPDGSGHIEIFANGLWVKTIKGHIGHADHGLGGNQYFKFGPYRAAADSTWTLYYANFRRSAKCEDVLGDNPACALLR